MNFNICFLCISGKRRTIDIINTPLQTVYEKLTELKIHETHRLCYICYRRLQQCHQFQQLAHQTQGLFQSLHNKSNEIQNIISRPLVDLSMTVVYNFASPYNTVVKEETAVKEEIVNVEEEYDPDDLITNLHNLEGIIQSTEPKRECEEQSFITEQDISLKHISDSTILQSFSRSPDIKVNVSDNYNVPDTSGAHSPAINESKEPETSNNVESVRNKSLADLLSTKNSSNIEDRHNAYIKALYETYLHNKTPPKDNFVYKKRRFLREKPYSCDICDYKCSRKNYLLRHKRTHTGDKPFSCNICEYKGSDRGHLTRHYRVHTGEKPFRCEICGYECSDKSSIVSHNRKHKSEEKYRCDICSYGCSNKTKFLSHYRIHTGEKPFICDLCDYKTSDKGNLVVHIKRHLAKQKS